MPIQLDLLRSISFPEKQFAYTDRDTILYALGVGFGRELPAELSFIFERGLKALPTQATVIAWDDEWQERIGLDVTKIVHGEMRVTSHRPLAPSGEVRARFSIPRVIDKGPGRGAVVLAKTELWDTADNTLVSTMLSTVFARGDGGFGGENTKGPTPHTLPGRPADRIAAMPTRPEQAALYRLSGDLNPLHVDQEFAISAGFDRPILHGLCTWGMVAGQLVRTVCSGEPSRLEHFEARFTSPVYCGETLTTEIWIDGEVISFRTRVAERNVVVLDHGKALLRSVG
jgi:acyl dehydratase